ncbi:SPOSA6832_01144, partial [Sporobolomyces salmonicolor]
MLSEWRRLNATFVFLAAWFLLSDSFATLTSTAMLFAKTSLNLPTSSLILVAALVPSAGIAGAVLFPQLQKTLLPWSNHSVLILLAALAALVPLWGLVELKTAGQMYALSIVFGITARWFGLYSITDKSSSFVGPMLVAVVTNATGQIRHGFWLILGFFLLALPVLAKVDMRQGSRDAEAYDRVLVEDAAGEVRGETEEEEEEEEEEGGEEEAGWQ